MAEDLGFELNHPYISTLSGLKFDFQKFSPKMYLHF